MSSNQAIQQVLFEAYLEIDLADYPIGGAAPAPNLVQLDIIRFTANYSLNGIPTASCGVSMGLDMSNPSKTAMIHEVFQNLTYKKKAKVFVKLNKGYESAGLDVTKDKITDIGYFVAFEGYTSGAGYRRGSASVEYTISLEHWLSDMTASTALTPELQPGTPFTHLFPCETRASSAGVLSNRADKYFSISETPSDLWAKGLYRFFNGIAGSVIIGQNDFYTATSSLPPDLAALFAVPANTDVNNIGLKAVERFLKPGEDGYVALSLSSKTATSQQIQINIVNTLKKTAIGGIDGQTFWDILVSAGASFMFNVVPLVSRAVLTPKLPNYKNSLITVKATEITNFDITTSMPRLIRGVLMPVSHVSEAGAFLGERLLGAAHFKSDKGTGTFVIHKRPTWLDNIVDPAEATKQGPGQVRIDGSAPEINNDGIKNNLQAIESTAARFAKLSYGNEVLKFRAGTFSGKFRMDISPGSIVKIEASGARGIQNDTTNVNDFLGMVNEVNLILDSTSATAMTSFSLSSVRTESENNDTDLVFDSNPLYDTVWSGTSLV
jgi:hypothetical protein